MRGGSTPGAVATEEDLRLVDALRRGDEAAFAQVVRTHHPAMLRLASMYVPSRGVAEEVVQEAWLGVVRGIDRFEGRSSLRTWMYRILVNTAKTRGIKERRSIPFSSLSPPEDEDDERAVEAGRFLPSDHPRWPHHWDHAPASWDGIPEDRLLGGETRAVVETAIAGLRPSQREVITLRDVLGWESREVCEALGITEVNQRVLLHRARSHVRRALEGYLDAERATA